MKLPLSWLNEFCDTGLEAGVLAERLAMTGTEVERIEQHGVGGLESFVVGKVLSAEQHPDADRLRVCQVDVGDGEPSSIVCGAPNVAAGQTVAVARPGAVMPDGTKLKKAKLRGVESQGMICAEDELGLGADHAGIMVLDDALAAGTPLAEVLPIADTVLELEITPNRPDCLGVYGVAREAHAATGAPLAPPPWAEDPFPGEGDAAGVQITVEDPDLCPRFTARAYEGVTIGPSPRWLKARLMAAGQRPINNVVDITNYVMLLTGQPTHAFDLDRVAGARLTVRRARDGETMTTLDDVERTLDGDTVVIEDGDGPTSIAGIMGGQRSEVSEATTRVLFEAATWNGPNINRTMARLGLRSEAGGRFEKGLQPEQAMDAQAIAAQLFVEVVGATPVPGTIDVGGPGPAPQVIRLRDARVRGLLGMDVPRERSQGVLEALGFGVAAADDGLDVTVPVWRRADVTREADLIEEVARLVVLDDLPATIPVNRMNLPGALSPAQRARRRAQDALLGTGLTEVVGWSFTSRETLARLGTGVEPIALENPMSEEQAVLRTTLLASLLDVMQLNAARGNPPQGIFESGAVYLPRGAAPVAVHPRRDSAAGEAAGKPGAEGLPAEYDALGALVPGDFFAAKSHLEALARALRVELTFDRAAGPFLHPGRAAHAYAGGELVGWLGEVHPRTAAEWDLGKVAAFELDLDRLIDAMPQELHYTDLTSFPELRQDLAVVVDADVPAAQVLATVRGAGGARLARADVFDVYVGAQIPEGRKSLALALAFRAPDRTLSDEDVAPVRDKIVAKLAEELGGELRG
jgi:phenylalanyl-tRNA synthetase beta chain